MNIFDIFSSFSIFNDKCRSVLNLSHKNFESSKYIDMIASVSRWCNIKPLHKHRHLIFVGFHVCFACLTTFSYGIFEAISKPPKSDKINGMKKKCHTVCLCVCLRYCFCFVFCLPVGVSVCMSARFVWHYFKQNI